MKKCECGLSVNKCSWCGKYFGRFTRVIGVWCGSRNFFEEDFHQEHICKKCLKNSIKSIKTVDA